MGAVVLSAAYFVGYNNFYAILPFLAIGGVPLGVFSTIAYPMVGDSLDYLEWKTGERLEGFCFSLNSSVTKFNNAFAAITVSVFLVLIQFKQPVEDAMALWCNRRRPLKRLMEFLPRLRCFRQGDSRWRLFPCCFTAIQESAKSRSSKS